MERDEEERQKLVHKKENIEKKDWNPYYERTKDKPPCKILQQLFRDERLEPGKAIDIGCGAGKETVYLIQRGWEVTGIDGMDVKGKILERLKEDEKNKFEFERQRFENIQLDKNNLIVANNSLPFCKRDSFENLLEKIKDSILPGGYFVGSFFGLEHEWRKRGAKYVFLSEQEVKEIFKDFQEIEFNETKKLQPNEQGTYTFWHKYNVIYKK